MNKNNWQTTISKHAFRNKKAWYSRLAIISKTKIMIQSEDETSL